MIVRALPVKFADCPTLFTDNAREETFALSVVEADCTGDATAGSGALSELPPPQLATTTASRSAAGTDNRFFFKASLDSEFRMHGMDRIRVIGLEGQRSRATNIELEVLGKNILSTTPTCRKERDECVVGRQKIAGLSRTPIVSGETTNAVVRQIGLHVLNRRTTGASTAAAVGNRVVPHLANSWQIPIGIVRDRAGAESGSIKRRIRRWVGGRRRVVGEDRSRVTSPIRIAGTGIGRMG